MTLAPVDFKKFIYYPQEVRTMKYRHLVVFRSNTDVLMFLVGAESGMNNNLIKDRHG